MPPSEIHTIVFSSSSGVDTDSGKVSGGAAEDETGSTAASELTDEVTSLDEAEGMLEEVAMLEDSIASCVLDETAAGVLLAARLWLLETVLTEELADTAETDCSVSIEASPPPKKNTRQISPILQFFVSFIRSQSEESAGIGSVRIKQIKKAIKAMCGCLNVPDIIIKEKKKMLKKTDPQPGFFGGSSPYCSFSDKS